MDVKGIRKFWGKNAGNPAGRPASTTVAFDSKGCALILDCQIGRLPVASPTLKAVSPCRENQETQDGCRA